MSMCLYNQCKISADLPDFSLLSRKAANFLAVVPDIDMDGTRESQKTWQGVLRPEDGNKMFAAPPASKSSFCINKLHYQGITIHAI